MKNKQVIEKLNIISKLIKEEKYEQAIDHIERKKIELISEEEPVSEYLDKLVSNLK